TGTTFAANLVNSGRPQKYGAVWVAQGGAIWSHTSLFISQNSFFTNQAVGSVGNGHDVVGGGEASGGAIFNENSLQILDSLFVSNLAQGGVGSSDVGGDSRGGTGRGGAICNLGMLTSTNCTLLNNSARGGGEPVGGIGGHFVVLPEAI